MAADRVQEIAHAAQDKAAEFSQQARKRTVELGRQARANYFRARLKANQPCGNTRCKPRWLRGP